MQKLNILLIEDDPLDVKTIRHLLHHCKLLDQSDTIGANIFHADRLRIGIEILEQETIDLILLDLHLPDGEGSELIERLNTQQNAAPIIVLTGMDQEGSQGVELVRCGAQDYLPKNQLEAVTLTRSIRYALQRHELRLKLQQQAQTLQDTNEELERFVYLVSHDLRSPLLNMQGFASRLNHSLKSIRHTFENATSLAGMKTNEQLKHELYENTPKSLQFIHSATERMDRLTSVILQLSRLGKRALHFETIDVMLLVHQCIDALEHQISSSKTSITVNKLPSINADRLTIEHAFSNVLDNALKYLTPGKPGQIIIDASVNNTHVAFSVQDNGRGIKDQDQHKVFEAFRRGESAGDIPGEGMGLPFVRTIIKLHGGDIWFDSTPDKGTTFYFTIPCKPHQKQ